MDEFIPCFLNPEPLSVRSIYIEESSLGRGCKLNHQLLKRSPLSPLRKFTYLNVTHTLQIGLQGQEINSQQRQSPVPLLEVSSRTLDAHVVA